MNMILWSYVTKTAPSNPIPSMILTSVRIFTRHQKYLTNDVRNIDL